MDFTRELGKLIPVVVIRNEADAEPLARAVMEGGLPTMEVTFRTEAAAAVLRRIAQSLPGMLLGAGTVLSVEQVKAAVANGARYIVSPGFVPKVVDYCLAQQIPVLPGALTPTEIAAAAAAGLAVVKFFPAEASGGLRYLQAVAAPFPHMQFIPTGGIDATNLLAYLNFGQVCACGGSWMVKTDLIAAHRFDEIRQLTAAAAALAAGAGRPS